jgi:hypothetical protein
MNDATPRVIGPKIGDAMSVTVLAKSTEHGLSVDISDSQAPSQSWNDMIGHAESQIRPANREPCAVEPVKRLRRGDFVNEMTVDIEQVGAIVPGLDNMVAPYFLKHCQRICGNWPGRVNHTT